MVVSPKTNSRSAVQRECEIHPSIMIEVQDCNPSCALCRMFGKNICNFESSLSRIFENRCSPLSTGEDNIHGSIVVEVTTDAGDAGRVAAEAQLGCSGERSISVVAPSLVLACRGDASPPRHVT